MAIHDRQLAERLLGDASASALRWNGHRRQRRWRVGLTRLRSGVRRQDGAAALALDGDRSEDICEGLLAERRAMVWTTPAIDHERCTRRNSGRSVRRAGRGEWQDSLAIQSAPAADWGRPGDGWRRCLHG